MTRDLAAIEEDVALLDAVLEPIAKAPVDVDDPTGWRSSGSRRTRRTAPPCVPRRAVNPRFPATPEGVRSALMLLSVRDQGADTRDELMVLWAVCGEARAAGVDVDPILREVAAISSDVDRYGMGSVREIFLEAVR